MFFSLIQGSIRVCHVDRRPAAEGDPQGADGLGILRVFFFFLRFYVFLERGKGGRNRGRETSMWERYTCFSHAPNWGPGLQPRHAP